MTDADPTRNESVGDDADQTAAESVTEDADTDTSRRRVCQALAVLGVSSLAGCSALDQAGSPTTGTQAGTSTSVPSAADIDTLIQDHIEAVSGRSYTVNMELQGSGSDPDIKKVIEYLRSSSGRPLVSLTEVSTIDDGVESLTHFFAPDTHGVQIGFVDGTTNSAALDISSRVLEITGESVFREYLIGAAVDDPEEVTDTATGQTLESYPVHAHSRYDFDEGVVVVGPEGVIQRFRLDWTDDDGVHRWVVAETSDVGTTEVDRPNF